MIGVPEAVTVRTPPEAAILPLAAWTGVEVAIFPVIPRGVAGVVTPLVLVLDVPVMFPVLELEEEQPLKNKLRTNKTAKEQNSIFFNIASPR